MKRAPFLVLLSGVLSDSVGAVLILFSRQVEGLFWLAVPITILGLVLLVIWFHSQSRPPPPEDPPA